MRYLYGDSSPFQLQYDFLATLEKFVAAGARAVRLERETAELRARSDAASQDRERELAQMSAFHGAVAQGIRAVRANSEEAKEHGRKIEAYAAELLEETRRAAAQVASREADAENADSARRSEEARHAVETFLLVGRLPTLEVKASLDLVQGENQLRAVFYNPLRIVTSFDLEARRAPAWKRERKVSEFTRGLSAQVGIKKSLFKRSMQPEVVELDDLIVGGFELSNDVAEIRLRKKADAKDMYVFNLRRETQGLVGQVTREGDEAPLALEPPDVAEIEKLWQFLRAGIGEVLLHRERLRGVLLDDVDLFAGDVSPFFARVVKLFAPLVAEIGKRSPNPAELSLKVEDDAGRREEIYLKKRDLTDKLAALDDVGRAIFAPLLDDRAPGRDELPSLDVCLDTMDEL